MHNLYNLEYFDYDFSLLKLKKSLTFTNKIQSIDLPTQDEEVVPGTFCIVSGWGDIYDRSGAQKELRATTLQIVDHTKCARSWVHGDGHVGDIDGDLLLTRQMICAGARTSETDACHGKFCS